MGPYGRGAQASAELAHALSLHAPCSYWRRQLRSTGAVAVLGLSVWGSSGGHGFGLRAFSRNNYRFPTTNYTMQVFGSDA